MHAWHEPFDRIIALAAARGVPVSTPRMGEAVSILQAHAADRWWLDVKTRRNRKPMPAASPRIVNEQP